MLLIGVIPGCGLFGLAADALALPLTPPISPSGDVGLETLATAGARSGCPLPFPRISFMKLFVRADILLDSRFLSALNEAGGWVESFGGTTGDVSVVVSELVGDISDTSCSASICWRYFCCCSCRWRSAASRSACCCLRIRSTALKGWIQLDI
jgi:hypothetical protein